MPGTDYMKAYKMGKKDYQHRMMHGMNPTLQVLDDILPPKGNYSEVPLGLVQIPTELIVGTKTEGRRNAFAGNYMPILKENTEFAAKWASLCASHVEEGIREPIKAYEYMNKFYVLEGNKRVSVMKYFDVVSIPGNVIRIIPRRTDEKENKIYFEFLDFYNLSKINYIWFSEEGSFAKLQSAVGKGPEEMWTEDERIEFRSVYTRFNMEYKTRSEKQNLSTTPGDALLRFIELQGYKEICEMTTNEIKTLVVKSWEEFELLQEDEDVDLKMDPIETVNSGKKYLLSLLPTQKLKVAFIYEKTVASSAWTYSHELGRLYLEQTFPDEVSTIYYDNVTVDNAAECMEEAIKEGCTIIFTTTPSFAKVSVKVAIEHPDVKILNCSIQTSHRYIRTYYSRMFEAKFLMGAIAGAMAENDKLYYIADFPIFGTIANINAFALGAKMINPRAKVYLDWTCLKDADIGANIEKIQPSIVSGKDMVVPEEGSRYFGLYHMEDGVPRNLAMPISNWGKFYERLIRRIMDGTWKYDDNTVNNKAINYWWGMSAEVVDVIFSKNLPVGTKRLIELLRKTICSNEFAVFCGVLYSQNGIVQDDPERWLTPEEVAKMDWLAENVIGRIPTEEELHDGAKPVVSQQGVEKTISKKE